MIIHMQKMHPFSNRETDTDVGDTDSKTIHCAGAILFLFFWWRRETNPTKQEVELLQKRPLGQRNVKWF